MLNSPMPSIFQHFQAIPLCSPLISLRSKWRLTGFSRRFTPKNPVRLHKPSGQLPRWGAKNDLPLNLIALPMRVMPKNNLQVTSHQSLATNHQKKEPLSRFLFLISSVRRAVSFFLRGRRGSLRPHRSIHCRRWWHDRCDGRQERRGWRSPPPQHRPRDSWVSPFYEPAHISQ